MFTSKEILKADDLYDLQDMASSGIAIEYQLTDSEIGWLDFIRGNYSISDYIDSNMQNGVLTISCSEELSEVLEGDAAGFGKAVMLADDTALQRIIFWLYSPADFEGVRS